MVPALWASFKKLDPRHMIGNPVMFVTEVGAFITTFEIFRADYPETRDLGDRVLAIGTVHVRGRGSGVETEVPSAGVAWFRGGKATRWEDFGDRKLAMGAAGLTPE